jgi:hypothetical protein
MPSKLTPKVPPGDKRVSLGKKSEAPTSKQGGSVTHKAGTQTEADTSHHGKTASKRQAIKAPTTLGKGRP